MKGPSWCVASFCPFSKCLPSSVSTVDGKFLQCVISMVSHVSCSIHLFIHVSSCRGQCVWISAKCWVTEQWSLSLHCGNGLRPTFSRVFITGLELWFCTMMSRDWLVLWPKFTMYIKHNKSEQSTNSPFTVAMQLKSTTYGSKI